MTDTLFRLPLEVRHNIYAYLLVTNKNIYLFWRMTTTRVLTKLNLHLSILRTCRKISQECLKVLHGSNHYIHMSNQSLYHYNTKEWRFLNKTLHTDLDMQLLNPVPTMPFLRNIRHLELRFGSGFDFGNVLSCMYCIRDGICDLITLGLELLSTWSKSDIKHVLRPLKRVRVFRSITISAWQRRDFDGQSIFENLEEALVSWDAIRQYIVKRQEHGPEHDHENLSINPERHEFRRWILKIPR